MTHTDLVRLFDRAAAALADQISRHRAALRGPQPTVRICWCRWDGARWQTGRGAEAVTLAVGRAAAERLAETGRCDVWLEVVWRVG